MYSFPGHVFSKEFENEKIIKVVHRHWFNLFIHFFGVIFATFAIFGSWAFIITLYPDIFEGAGNAAMLHFVVTTAILFVWFYAFLIWIDYYFDVWIITETRIINIEQKGLFAREASDLQINNIQDVSSEVTGIIPTILNFGDILIQTAGEKEQFRFRQVPDPYALKALIMELSAKRSK